MNTFRWIAAALLLCSSIFAQSQQRIVSPEIHPDGKVTFRLQAPKASEAGFFGDWMTANTSQPMTRNSEGLWSVTVGPIKPGIYIYHFVVDGMTIADPVNPAIKLRARTSASLLHVKGNAPELWEARDVAHGTVEINYHAAPSLNGEMRQAWVYKPAGYDRNRSRRYPVLFLLHGNNDTPAGWTMVGGANYILDNLIAEGKAREMVVVMPFGHAVHFDAPPQEQPQNTARMERYVIQDLAPLIEKSYRVASGRQNRAIVGLSMGGGHALHIGFSHLDRFSAIGAFSSAVPQDFRTRFAKAMNDPNETNRKLNLLWIGCGRQDFAFERSKELSTLLTSHGIDHIFRATEGAHTFTVWREYLIEVAPLLFRDRKR